MDISVISMMLIIEVLEVGLNTINKAAKTKGMRELVFIVYSNSLAVFVLLLSSLFHYRTRSVLPITVSIVCKIFLLGTLSCSVQICMYTGIGYSSPTLASALVNLTPAFAFIFAVIFRMEKLDLRTHSSLAKSIGTVLSIGGALVVTLYKGYPIMGQPSIIESVIELELKDANWVIGGVLLAAASLILALLFIVLTWIIEEFPEEIIVTLICFIFATVESVMIALIVERDPNEWKLNLDMELLAIGYSAVFVVAGRSVVHTWVCLKKGPVFAASFKPIGVVIAVVMGISFLRDTLYIGSVIGATILAIGFYGVIWGKAQEEKFINETSDSSSSNKAPLLENKSMQV